MSNEAHIEVLRTIFRREDGPSAIEKRDAFRAAIKALSVLDDALEMALTPNETFDPQAVRELLVLVDAFANSTCRTSEAEYTVSVALVEQLYATASVVRESEKR